MKACKFATSFTQKSSSLTSETSPSEDNDKQQDNGETQLCQHVIISRPATNLKEKKVDCRTSSCSDSVAKEVANNNSSEAAGYRNSNESSSGQDNSSGTSITSKSKGESMYAM